MSKRYLKTLAALAALAALWGVFTFFNRKAVKKEAETASAKSSEKLLPLKSSQIESFTLTPLQGQPIICERQGKKWAILKPEPLPADPTSVSGFLDSLTDATVDQVVAQKPADLGDFGLSEPSETIEVRSGSKPSSFTLLLGSETPTNDGIYAQVAGNPRVMTLADYLKSSLEKSVFDLRDKRAVTLDPDQITQIQVKAKDKSFTLKKNPEGVWELDLPPAVRADSFTVSSMVDGLRRLNMQSILSEAKKDSPKYGFGAPEMTVRLSGAGESQTLVVGKKNGANYDAMNTALAPVFTLGADFFSQFDKNAPDLRAKDLFSFETFEAHKVDIQTPKGHWTIEKQSGQWKETAPATKSVSSDKVETLLEDLRDLSAQSFPKKDPTDLAAYDLIHPTYRFAVTSGEKNQTETVEASSKNGHLYARRATDAAPSELASDALDSMEKALGGL